MGLKLIATVCLFSGIDRELTYEVDERLASEIQAGSMVLVPLKNMTTSAIVKRVEYADTSQWEFKLRKIYSFVQPEPVLSPDLIELAEWIKNVIQLYAAYKRLILESKTQIN